MVLKDQQNINNPHGFSVGAVKSLELACQWNWSGRRGEEETASEREETVLAKNLAYNVSWRCSR
jgi:hypothetical protein